MMFVLRAFYSLKDTLTPALANVGASVVQIGLYVLLTTGFGAWAGLGINGIPIADAIFYALLLFVLILLMRRKIGGYDLSGVLSTYGKMLVVSVVGGLAAYGVSSALSDYVTGIAGSLIQITVGTTVCLLIALGLGRAFGVREVASATALAGRAFARLRPRKRR
jgi:peptidoglycan biosynthesis protein MviN/MurJ (putative lipid II flippase)